MIRASQCLLVYVGVVVPRPVLRDCDRAVWPPCSSDVPPLLVAVPGSGAGLSILSDNSFKSLAGQVSEQTLRAVADMGFTHMTEIQAKTIPHLLEGR